MSKSLSVQATPDETGLPANPFQRPQREDLSPGAVTIEETRATSEVQARLLVAKRFPRDRNLAHQKLMESCRRPGFAEEATYSYPRGSETISGPTIRFAEEVARCLGNLEFGIRELSRRDGYSEMQVFCTDLETLTGSNQTFTVRHVRDTRQGQKPLADERDIYELTANQAGRRLRARILSIIPPDFVTDALAVCKQTLAGNSEEPMVDRVRKMVGVFARFGVTVSLIEKRLGHSLDTVLPEELADLRQIYNSLRDGATRPGEWFAVAEQAANALNDRLGIGKAPAAAADPENGIIIEDGPVVATTAQPASTEPRRF